MAQNANANECDKCGTTENLNELTPPGSDAVLGVECDECLEESVEEINAEQEERWNEEADAFEGVEVKSDGNLSPAASHVRRVVEEAYEEFVRDGHGHAFAGEPCLWDRGDYGDGYGVVFTLPFRDERVREEFFDYWNDSDYPEGVEDRLNSGYFEWVNGFAFELVDA